MEDNILYKKRGAGLTGNADLRYSKSHAANAPLCRLKLSDSGITFSFVGRKMTLTYEDIERITISKSGYIRFFAKDPTQSFAFASTSTKKIVTILQSKGVTIDQTELDKLNTAVMVIRIENILAVIIIVVVVLLLIRLQTAPDHMLSL